MDCWIKNEDREAMKKNTSAVSVIGGADGPTSDFKAKKSHKRTLRQKLDRLMYQIRKVNPFSYIITLL